MQPITNNAPPQPPAAAPAKGISAGPEKESQLFGAAVLAVRAWLLRRVVGARRHAPPVTTPAHTRRSSSRCTTRCVPPPPRCSSSLLNPLTRPAIKEDRPLRQRHEGARSRNVRRVPRLRTHHIIETLRASGPVQFARRAALADHLVELPRLEHSGNDLFHPPWGKHNPASWRGRHLAGNANSSGLKLAAAHGDVCRRDRQGPVDLDAVDLPPPLRRAPLVEAANEVPRPSARPSPWRSSGPRWCTTITWWTLVEPVARRILSSGVAAFTARFEDLLFEPRAVAGAVCDCLGGALCGNQPVRRRGRAVRNTPSSRRLSMAWRTTRKFERRRKILISTGVAPSHRGRLQNRRPEDGQGHGLRPRGKI